MRLLSCLFLLVGTALHGAEPASHLPTDKFKLGDWEDQIGYRQAVRSGHTLYISGSVGAGPMPAAINGAYGTLKKTLSHYGLTFADVVKENIYTTDIEALKANLAARRAFYGEDLPAATWVQVSRLYETTHVIEVEVIAVFPDAGVTGAGAGQPPELGAAARSYAGVPFHDTVYSGGPQVIPGTLQNEYFDTLDIPDSLKASGAEEGITYHDTDNQNSGSGMLNGTGTYLKEFRMHESADTSYTKFNNPGTLIDDSPYNLVRPEPNSLYLGWIAPGEWVRYTVDVHADGIYALNIMYTSKFGGHISLDSDGRDVSGPLTIPSTSNSADPVEWRQAHHWNKIYGVGHIPLKKGRQVLTLHFLDQPVMNFDYMEFVPAK